MQKAHKRTMNAETCRSVEHEPRQGVVDGERAGGQRPRAASICFAIAAAFSSGQIAQAATILVPSGGDLQAALTSAQPGDTIVLQQGATYVGNFTLPNKGGASLITLETSPQGLPGEGARIGPGQAPALAKLRSPNNMPALQTAPDAHGWRIALIEFQANAGGAGDIITLGDGSSAQSSLLQVPHDLVIDRCYIHGDPRAGQKRGIALNSAATTVSNSYVADIKAVGEDSQAIAGWNGPGPFTITNNYLEAAGENVLFGGADPAIPNLVPTDITIAGNLLSKPIAWRSQNWQVKNLLELKNARRVAIQQNTLQYNWQAAQSGFAVLFTVRNQGGHCPWCQVELITFQNNVLAHSAAGVSILGYDDSAPSQQTRSIVIRNNVFADIDNKNWGGNGYFVQVLGGPRDITIDHNTIIQDDASGILLVDGPQILGFVFTNNVVRQNAYGVLGSNHSPGNDSISAYFPGSQIVGNVIADANPDLYPGGNRFPTSAAFRAQFVSYSGGDYRLVANSSWRLAGTDGRDLGADFSSVPRQPTRSRPPPPAD